jgi:uncharacterized protein
VRAVLDANVLISALLSPTGSPARVVRAWQAGQFELIVSARLLAEVQRALAYPKLRRLVSAADAEAVVAWLANTAMVVPDPDGPPPVHASDRDDDYLIALAADQNAMLVSGDGHLLELAARLPVRSPASFLSLLAESAD